MSKLALNYLVNVCKLLAGKRVLRPLVAVYHLTPLCNLNCRYCEDYGRDRNTALSKHLSPLNLTEAQRLLGIIRQGCDQIMFTGGEPLLYPHVDQLVQHARRVLGFRGITLLTNGLLLDKHPSLLNDLNRLVISLDSVQVDVWEQTLRVEPGSAARIIQTIKSLAARQRELGLRLVINCVITPETLDQVEGVLQFCQRHDLTLSLSPQARNNWPRYELLTSDDYQALMQRLAGLKRGGSSLLISHNSLRRLSTFEPFKCYPTLFPQIWPDGSLVYPCRPIQKSTMPQGGLACNLLEVASWRAALRQATSTFGEPPLVCTSCFQQCYIEPSLMQARPLSLLWELIRYPTSRQVGLLTYTTG